MAGTGSEYFQITDPAFLTLIYHRIDEKNQSFFNAGRIVKLVTVELNVSAGFKDLN